MIGTKALNDLILTSKTYIAKDYPAFVYSTDDVGIDMPIFFYHQISRSDLEIQFKFLAANGYRPVHCDQALASMAEGSWKDRKEVVLTFDDGLEGVYLDIFPILKKYNMKAVVYLVPGWIGQKGYLTWDQCRKMHESGLVDFQSHSFVHLEPDLYGGKGKLEDMAKDLMRSKVRIEDEIPGQKVNHFAFPWHLNSPLAWEALGKVGFLSGAVGIRSTCSSLKKGQKVARFYRVNGDFLMCLPGKNRKAGMNIFMKKILRRIYK